MAFAGMHAWKTTNWVSSRTSMVSSGQERGREAQNTSSWWGPVSRCLWRWNVSQLGCCWKTSNYSSDDFETQHLPTRQKIENDWSQRNAWFFSKFLEMSNKLECWVDNWGQKTPFRGLCKSYAKTFWSLIDRFGSTNRSKIDILFEL